MRVLNPEVIQACGVLQDDIAAVQVREQAAVGTRAARYRAGWPRQPLDGRVAVVPGATHLFEEPGALDAAAALARDWFLGHLPHDAA